MKKNKQNSIYIMCDVVRHNNKADDIVTFSLKSGGSLMCVVEDFTPYPDFVLLEYLRYRNPIAGFQVNENLPIRVYLPYSRINYVAIDLKHG